MTQHDASPGEPTTGDPPTKQHGDALGDTLPGGDTAGTRPAGTERARGGGPPAAAVDDDPDATTGQEGA